MKKAIVMLLVLIGIIFTCPLTVFAGDIPESLLHSEESQLFFGEVLAYRSDQEAPEIEVTPRAVIKGNVPQGTAQVYKNPNPMGDFAVRTGKIYLFVYYSEANAIDIFEVTTYNTRTLKLRHVSGSMWDRFETYLNQGRYGEATVPTSGIFPENIAFGIIGMVIFLAAATTMYLFQKKKDPVVTESASL